MLVASRGHRMLLLARRVSADLMVRRLVARPAPAAWPGVVALVPEVVVPRTALQPRADLQAGLRA